MIVEEPEIANTIDTSEIKKTPLFGRDNFGLEEEK